MTRTGQKIILLLLYACTLLSSRLSKMMQTELMVNSIGPEGHITVEHVAADNESDKSNDFTMNTSMHKGITTKTDEAKDVLESFTQLTEEAFDNHLSRVRAALKSCRTGTIHQAAEQALTELAGIRRTLRNNTSSNGIDLPPLGDHLAQLKMLESLGQEASRRHEAFTQHLSILPQDLCNSGGNTTASSLLSLELKKGLEHLVALGRMVADTYRVVSHFVTHELVKIAHVYMGPGVEFEGLEGCSGANVGIEWDLTELLLGIYHAGKKQKAQEDKLDGEVTKMISTEGQPMENRGFVNRMKSLMHELVTVVGRCHDTRVGRQSYPVEVSMTFSLGFKGCALPYPHGRPSVSFEVGVNAGLVACIVEQEASIHLSQLAEVGWAIMEHTIDLSASQLLSRSRFADPRLDPRLYVSQTVDEHHSCLNGLLITFPIAPVPFPLGMGVDLSVKRCGWDKVKKVTKHLFSKENEQKLKAKEAVQHDGTTGLPTATGTVEANGHFDTSEVTAFQTHAEHSGAGHEHGGGPCSELDCFLALDVKWLTMETGVQLRCGPVSGALACARSMVASAWERLTDDDMSKPLLLMDSAYPSDGHVCCMNPDVDLADTFWKPARGDDWCAETNGWRLARAYVPKIQNKNERSEAQVEVKVEWWNEAQCEGSPIRISQLAFAQFQKGELSKPTGWFNQESVAMAKRLGKDLVLVSFEYAPVNYPTSYCCCNPVLEDSDEEQVPTCVPVANDQNNTEGLALCETKDPEKRPVIYYSLDENDEFEFRHPTEEQCVNTAWNWNTAWKLYTVWMPKFKIAQKQENSWLPWRNSNSELEFSVHGITEALVAQAPQQSSL